MRPVRHVMLLYPFQLPLSLALLSVAVVFTVFPEMLEHSPVSFETRGIIHHLFHYALLVGSALMLAGLFATHRWHIKAELIGLVLVFSAIALNLVAILSDEFSTGDGDPLSGMTVAIRSAILGGLVVRMWIVTVQPEISLPANDRRNGTR